MWTNKKCFNQTAANWRKIRSKWKGRELNILSVLTLSSSHPDLPPGKRRKIILWQIIIFKPVPGKPQESPKCLIFESGGGDGSVCRGLSWGRGFWAQAPAADQKSESVLVTVEVLGHLQHAARVLLSKILNPHSIISFYYLPLFRQDSVRHK